MLCESCKKNEATVHLTQVADDTVKKIHLCEECAAKSGLDVHGSVSITDLLLGLGKALAPRAQAGEEEKACPRCHMRPSDFKKAGRLGCPGCYEAFAVELGPLIKGMHRSEQHVGKKPAARGPAIGAEDLEVLQQALERAIAEEKFEEAARLRDRLQAARTRRQTAPGGSGP